MSQKIVISKPGFNAGTETNPDNLIFSSDYNTLKYYNSGNGTISITSDGTAIISTSGTIAHNLGYIPFFVCFASAAGTSGNNVPLIETTIAVTRYFSAFADSSNIYVVLQSNTSTPLTYYYNYKIYRNNTGL